jgi:hypothetical protein
LLYRVYFPKSLHCYFLQICYQAGQNVESNILELRRWGVSAFMSIPCPAHLPSSLPRGVDDEEIRHKVSDDSVPTDESAMHACLCHLGDRITLIDLLLYMMLECTWRGMAL